MSTTIGKTDLDVAVEMLMRIKALPLVRRRGQPEHHREPCYLGQTESDWTRRGIFDEGGGLLRLAAKAAIFVTRWQLQTSVYVAQIGWERWAYDLHDFDKVFGNKPRYQLIEVLEALVNEKMDLPTLPIYEYGLLLPEWEEVLFGEPVLVHDIKDRYARIHVEIRDSDRRSVEVSVYDYSPRKLLEVTASDKGCGSGINGAPFEKRHVRAIKVVLGRLVQVGMLPLGVIDQRLQELCEMAKPDDPKLIFLGM